jgi:hypothetical protein
MTASPRGRRLDSGLRAAAYRRRTSVWITSVGFRRHSQHPETRDSPPIQRAPPHCGPPWSQPQHGSRQPPQELICRTFRGKFAAGTQCNRSQSGGNNLASRLDLARSRFALTASGVGAMRLPAAAPWLNFLSDEFVLDDQANQLRSIAYAEFRHQAPPIGIDCFGGQ